MCIRDRSAAIYAKRANLNVAVAEKEYEGTGQIAESGNVNNYLGLPNINGYDLGEKFREHAVSLDVEFIEKEAVQIEAVQNGEKEEPVIYRVKFDDDTIAEEMCIRDRDRTCMISIRQRRGFPYPLQRGHMLSLIHI